MEKLLGKTPSQLKEIALSAGLPGFTGNQLAQWIYGKRARTLAEMTNLSKAGRERLAESYEVGVALPLGKATSSDGRRYQQVSVPCQWQPGQRRGGGHDPGRGP